MTVRVATAVGLIVGLLAAAVGATSSTAAVRGGSFRMPSGNIICAWTVAAASQTYVECGIKSGLVGARPYGNCPVGDPQVNRVVVAARGRGRRVLCAGDPGPFTQIHAPVLRYGHTWRGGGLECASTIRGLTCTNRERHGFFLSRERWRIY